MKETLIKLQIESLEQQLKVLKAKISSKPKGETLGDLLGICEGELDLTLEEIKKYEYTFKDNI